MQANLSPFFSKSWENFWNSWKTIELWAARQRFYPYCFESNEDFPPTNTDLFNFVWNVTVPGFWLKVGKEIAFFQNFSLPELLFNKHGKLPVNVGNKEMLYFYVCI